MHLAAKLLVAALLLVFLQFRTINLMDSELINDRISITNEAPLEIRTEKIVPFLKNPNPSPDPTVGWWCIPASKHMTWGDTSPENARIPRWHCPPTYLAIGFPKCGSSTLWRLLKQHPRVKLFRGGAVKEAHFWHQQYGDFSADRQYYLKKFPPLNETEMSPRYQIAVGDHTPGYVWRVPYRCKMKRGRKYSRLQLMCNRVVTRNVVTPPTFFLSGFLTSGGSRLSRSSS